jgi:hypothetical protein
MSEKQLFKLSVSAGIAETSANISAEVTLGRSLFETNEYSASAYCAHCEILCNCNFLQMNERFRAKQFKKQTKCVARVSIGLSDLCNNYGLEGRSPINTGSNA